jgi:uncharacterized protein YndB with AHSA1/START domain
MRNVVKSLLVVGCLGAAYVWLIRPRLAQGVDRDEPADVTNRAQIDAPPDAVFRAIVDEHDGKTSWWTPHHSMELREGNSYGEAGALLDNTVRVRGRFPIRFTTRTVEVEDAKMIRIEYVEGAFRGEARWTFESVAGKTELSQRWQTTPVGMLRNLAPFLPRREESLGHDGGGLREPPGVSRPDAFRCGGAGRGVTTRSLHRWIAAPERSTRQPAVQRSSRFGRG